MKEWRVGERVAGYELLAELGRGGMGVVFRARELATGRELALKTLTFLDPEEASRLQREGEALARLAHPNLLRVFGAGEHAGRPYLALELAAGGSLAARLERETRLEWRAACDLVAPLAQALAAAHEVGLVHRDLKPGNVLLDERGQPKLADFGLVRLDDRSRLTETGTLLGTPLYMAPEQARGEPAGAAADVYSLAALLYRCVAGRPPIARQPSVLAQLEALQRERPPRLGSELAPSALADLLERALAKDPAARPSAAELAQDLSEVEEARPGRGRALALGALALLVPLALLGWVSSSRSEAPGVAASPRPQLSATPFDRDPVRRSAVPTPEAHVLPTGEVARYLEELLEELRRVDPALGPQLASLAPLETRSVAAAAAPRAEVLLDCDAPEVEEHVAQLELARRGAQGWISPAVETCYKLSPRNPLSRPGRLLRESARHGYLRGLRSINESRGNRAAAMVYLGCSGQLLAAPKSVLRDLASRRPKLGDRFPSSPSAALAQLWDCELTEPGAAELRPVARHLFADPDRALEDYLDAWAEQPALRGDRFAEELQRCAELVAVGGLQQAGHGFGFAQRATPPAGLDLSGLPALRRALTRTLRCTNWARGRYLLALCEFPQWSPFFPPMVRKLPRARRLAARVELDRALELDPFCSEALLFRSALREQEGDLRGALRDLEQAALSTPLVRDLLACSMVRCLQLLTEADPKHWSRCRRLYRSVLGSGSETLASFRGLAPRQERLQREHGE